MRRRLTGRPAGPLPMRLRLAALLAALALGAAAEGAGAASRVVLPLAGDVKSLAFSGEAVVVARQPEGRGLRVERLVPGRPPQVLLRTTLRDDDDIAYIAASPQAVAVAIASEDPDDERAGTSRVVGGAATGPLRELARCESALTLPAIAVDGTRIAWAEGSCLVPEDRPRGVGPGAVVIGDADPAVALRRVPLPDERIALGISLRGEVELAGLLRPTLLSFYGGELRRIEGDAFGPAVLGGPAELVEPTGVLDGGVATAARNRFLDSEDVEDEEEVRPRGCTQDVVAIPPGGGGPPRVLPLGRCPDIEASETAGLFFALSAGAGGGVVTAGDRVVVRTFTEAGSGRDAFDDDGEDQPRRLVSVRADGGDRRVLARGGPHRGPLALVGGSGRVGWTQPRCGGGLELIGADPVPAAARPRATPGCRADLLTRRARLRGRSVRLVLRCPRGCRGRLVDRTMCTGETSRTFRFGPGTHRLTMPLSRRARRRGRALINVRAEHAPERFRRVQLTGLRRSRR